jgi:hypothetical protein
MEVKKKTKKRRKTEVDEIRVSQQKVMFKLTSENCSRKNQKKKRCRSATHRCQQF